MFSTHLPPPLSRSVRFSESPSPSLPLEQDHDDYSSSSGSSSTSGTSDDEQSERLEFNVGPSRQLNRTSSTGRLSPHRIPRKPLVSILKHRNKFEDGERDDEVYYNHFEVSVRPHRTSCCRALVQIEHISDWLHDTPSDGLCPSCKNRCSLELSTYPKNALTPTTSTATATSSKRSLTLRQLVIESLTLLIAMFFSSSQASSTSRSRRPAADFTSTTTTLFNDDEVYPSSEHTLVLGSSLVSINVFEVLTRVTSIAGLTLVLFALLS